MNLSKLQDTKSIHGNHLHFYILTMKKSEREIKESIPLTIATKRIKYLGINLSKEIKDLYTENYKTPMKKIKDDLNRWRNTPSSWVGRINTVKITILQKASYIFKCNPYQITNDIFHRTRKKISQLIWKHKRS